MRLMGLCDDLLLFLLEEGLIVTDFRREEFHWVHVILHIQEPEKLVMTRCWNKEMFLGCFLTEEWSTAVEGVGVEG